MNKRWKKTLIVSVFIVAVFLVSMIGFKFNIQKQLQNQQKTAAVLREQYPFAQSSIASRTPFSYVFPEKDTWLKLTDYVFRAEVVGDWEIRRRTINPTGDSNNGLDAIVETYYLPVKVTEWLDVRNGKEIPDNQIWVAYSFVDFNYSDASLFPVGSSFVFVGESPLQSREYCGKPVIGVDTLLTFYITDNEIILSFGAEQTINEFSGYSYGDFTAQIKRVADKSGWHDKQ